MNLIRLIKDFRKWRREKYERALSNEVCQRANVLVNTKYNGGGSTQAYYDGIMYGITHYKEILKQAKNEQKKSISILPRC